MLDSFPVIAGGVALIVVPATLFAAVLRRARVFGRGSEVAAAVVGGAIWGVLVGPGVMGVSWPDTYQQVFVGGQVQRETLQRLHREQAIELAVLQSSGATLEAVSEQRDSHSVERTPAEHALREALDSRSGVWDTVATVGAVTCVGLGLLLRLSRRSRCPGTGGRPSLLAGLAASLVPGTVGGVGLALGTGAAVWTSLAFGAVLSAGWILPSSRARLVGRAGREPSLDATCTVSSSVGWLGLAAGAKAVWPALGALGAWLMWRQSGARWARPVRRGARLALYGIVAPCVSACALSRIDPYAVIDEGSFWIAAGIAVIVGADGRWTCVFAVWRRMRPAESWRLAAERASAFALSGIGLGQCIAVVTLAAAGVLREIDIAALVLGAATLECAAGLYRVVSRVGNNGQRVGGNASLVDEPGDGASLS